MYLNVFIDISFPLCPYPVPIRKICLRYPWPAAHFAQNRCTVHLQYLCYVVYLLKLFYSNRGMERQPSKLVVVCFYSRLFGEAETPSYHNYSTLYT